MGGIAFKILMLFFAVIFWLVMTEYWGAMGM